MKPCTIIVPSYCPDDEVQALHDRCLNCLHKATDSHMYSLIIESGGDRSYPQKVNKAMSRICTRFALILSNDVFATQEGWLSNLIDDFESVHRCALMSPQDTPAQGITFDDHWWAAPLISLRAWEEIGPLDESLPLVFHDQDWSIRARKKNYQICRTSAALVRHVGLATRSRIGTEDSQSEREEMLRRYGVENLAQWVRLHP